MGQISDLNNKYALILNKLAGPFVVYERLDEDSGECEWCLAFEGDSQDIWERRAIDSAEKRIAQRVAKMQVDVAVLQAKEQEILAMMAKAEVDLLNPSNDVNNIYGAILHKIAGPFFVSQCPDPANAEECLWWLAFQGETVPEKSSWESMSLVAAKNRIVEKLGILRSSIEEISTKISSINGMLAEAQASISP